MDTFHWMLLLIVAGFLLLGVGFNCRDKEWGVGLLSLGVVCMLSSLLYKVYITFG
ncbi:hypothetical protein [Stutzerimonas azotifigens]|uniref:Amidotransferase n=1 Tax=Stutzerimonas azotifigens TaxID=291995 RepID=A0ABR5YVX8_9GAMM|nr:hypothetical protein [Stutzerimonas azotifigens]MBA1272100.1 hypothetical protein [Stutzerimonas azotifigens]